MLSLLSARLNSINTFYVLYYITQGIKWESPKPNPIEGLSVSMVCYILDSDPEGDDQKKETGWRVWDDSLNKSVSNIRESVIGYFFYSSFPYSNIIHK